MSIAESLTAFNPSEIKFKGYGAFVTDFVIQNQLTDRKTWKLFVCQFKNHTDKDNRWRGEYWGKMMRGASLCYSCTKNEKLYAVLRETVSNILSVAEFGGRISSYPKDAEFNGWDMWCRKYVLLGLLYFFDICKSKTLKEKIKKAVAKNLDYIIEHVGEEDGKKDIRKTSSNFGGLNSCSILEPVVKVYNLTGDKKYLDFAAYIVKSGFCLDANYIKLAYDNRLRPYEYPHTKAYEMTSCFQGLLEYYKVVREEKHFTAVLNFFNAVAATDLSIIGSCGCDGEFFDHSSVTQTEKPKVNEWVDGFAQETCVTVTWMNLCYSLLKFTGQAKYADYLETSALNAMYGAVNTEKQFALRALAFDTDAKVYKGKRQFFAFDSYSPLLYDRRGKGIGGFIPLDSENSFGCCASIGSAGVAIAELYSVMKGEDGIYFNSYGKASLKTEFNGKTVSVKSNADLYKNGLVKIHVTGGRCKLFFRIPKWSDEFELSVNGIFAQFKRERGYAVIDGDWNNDEIGIFLDNSLKKEELNGKIAIKKGPVVLARDERLEKDIDVPIDSGLSVRGKQIKNTAFKNNCTMVLKTKSGNVTMCDYASAGKNYDEEKCRITVWMNQKK